MRTLIKVTKNCIKDGAPSCGSCCPIALAIDDTFPSMYLCDFVTKTKVKIRKIRKTIALPRSAQRFIERFDYGKSVKPFNFYLDI